MTAAQISVRTPAGTFTGVQNDGIAHFYSIEYSTIPGPFENAERREATPDAVIDATIARAHPVALSVCAPTSALGQLKDLPVIAYIHGGRYEAGHHDESWYLGDSFARDDAIYVSIGYRLGLSGFARFHDDEPNHYRAIDDCQLALEWIQRNIESFGGDPTNVTLAGQSAGGGIALWLARRDHFRGAFRRLLLMSPGFPFTSFDQRKGWLRALGGVPVTRKALSGLSENKLRVIYKRFRNRFFMGPALGPAPYDPEEIVPLPVLLTHLRDEFYFEPAAKSMDKRGIGVLGVRMLARGFTLHGSVKDYLDYARKENPSRIAGRLVGDATIRRWVSETAEGVAGPVWLMEYVGTKESPAMHCADIPLVFDALDVSPRSNERFLGKNAERFQPIADYMHKTVLNFAHGVEPDWPAYVPEGDRAEQELNMEDGSKQIIHDPLRAVRKAFR